MVGKKLENCERFAKIFLTNIHRYMEKLYCGICTDCSLFTKFFLANSFYLYGSPKFSLPNISCVQYNIIYSDIHAYIHSYIQYINDYIIIYTVLQSVWEHVGCVNRPISGSANTRSCHVLLRIDKLLQHVSNLLVSRGLLMLLIPYISNHSRWKCFMAAELNFHSQNFHGWTVVLHGQSLLHKLFQWKSLAVSINPQNP